MDNLQFVAFCKAAMDLPTVYGWGMWGKPLTDSIIDAKAKQYYTHYDKTRVTYLKTLAGKAVGCDCTGLIKWFLWSGGDITAAPIYQSATDQSASGWYNKATVRGDIGTMPERQGLIVSKSGHCGVYIGGGKVIECTRGSRGDGVVESKLTAEKWTKWCQCPYIEYAEEERPITPAYKFTAGNHRAPVYADSELMQRTGSLDPGETCGCLGRRGEAVAVYYPVGGSEVYKLGFADSKSGTMADR